jgi:ribosomal protein L7/L12
MKKSLTIRCPICNKPKLFNPGDKKYKEVDSPVKLIDIATTNNRNTNPELTIVSFKDCGHHFLVSDKKLISFFPEMIKVSEWEHTTNGHELTLSDVNAILLVIGSIQGKMNAIKFYKSYSGHNLKESKEYVEKILSENGIKTKEGCFIATACYGNYDAKEVVILRMYRDQILNKSGIGRRIIKFYYTVSPSLAKRIDKSEKTKRFIRNFILNFIIRVIKNKVLTEKNTFI